MNQLLELFGHATQGTAARRWRQILRKRWCPFLCRLCLKNRKSNPEILIGSCSVSYGKRDLKVIICPHRMLEQKQIFTDCIHLLTLHQPGNQLHLVPQVTIPGGSVDYFLVSARDTKVMDFVGIELQTLDTTGTVWPARQRFLASVGVAVSPEDAKSEESFGMNWKMTAKTVLVQLHHKVQTFEGLNKHLVLVVQNHLLSYMTANFSFGHIEEARLGDSMQVHAYGLAATPEGAWRLTLDRRVSTDATGIAKALGLQASAKVELETIVAQLERKISEDTLFTMKLVPDVTMPTAPS